MAKHWYFQGRIVDMANMEPGMLWLPAHPLYGIPIWTLTGMMIYTIIWAAWMWHKARPPRTSTRAERRQEKRAKEKGL